MNSHGSNGLLVPVSRATQFQQEILALREELKQTEGF